jgi:outer membrane lipoprotein SlyB
VQEVQIGTVEALREVNIEGTNSGVGTNVAQWSAVSLAER